MTIADLSEEHEAHGETMMATAIREAIANLNDVPDFDDVA